MSHELVYCVHVQERDDTIWHHFGLSTHAHVRDRKARAGTRYGSPKLYAAAQRGATFRVYVVLRFGSRAEEAILQCAAEEWVRAKVCPACTGAPYSLDDELHRAAWKRNKLPRGGP